MDYFGILKRAVKTTWRYRALWLFGVLLALTSGGGSSPMQYSFGGNNRGQNSNWMQNLPGGDKFDWANWRWPSFRFEDHIGLIIGLALGALILIVISVIVRYLSENALIKMVNQAEETGSAGTVGEGFRKGWSRPAWRMFLADLVVGIPFALAAMALLLIGAAPLLLLTLETAGARALGIVLAVGLELIFLIAIIVVGVVVGLLLKFTYRELALANKGVLEGISAGWEMIRHNLRHVGLMWVLMLGAGIAWSLVMIPVILLLLVLAGLLGGAPGLALYAATKSVPAALGLGIPVFLLVFLIPTIFLGGLYQTFDSSVWTMTYRELAAKPALATGDEFAGNPLEPEIIA